MIDLILPFYRLLRLTAPGFRHEVYEIAEAKLAKRTRVLAVVLPSLCLTVLILHRPELLLLINWIVEERFVKGFCFEVSQAAQFRVEHGDRRVRAEDFNDRNVYVQSTLLLRREDNPIALRLFQLRRALYPWSSTTEYCGRSRDQSGSHNLVTPFLPS